MIKQHLKGFATSNVHNHLTNMKHEKVKRPLTEYFMVDHATKQLGPCSKRGSTSPVRLARNNDVARSLNLIANIPQAIITY